MHLYFGIVSSDSLYISVSVSTMTTLCLSFPLSLLFLSFFLSSSAHSFHDDRQLLLEFKSSITRDPHQSMADWSSDTPFCNWSGVTCRHHHQMDRVIALDLTAMDLQGIISPSLGNSTHWIFPEICFTDISNFNWGSSLI